MHPGAYADQVLSTPTTITTDGHYQHALLLAPDAQRSMSDDSGKQWKWRAQAQVSYHSLVQIRSWSPKHSLLPLPPSHRNDIVWLSCWSITSAVLLVSARQTSCWPKRPFPLAFPLFALDPRGCILFIVCLRSNSSNQSADICPMVHIVDYHVL